MSGTSISIDRHLVEWLGRCPSPSAVVAHAVARYAANEDTLPDIDKTTREPRVLRMRLGGRVIDQARGGRSHLIERCLLAWQRDIAVALMGVDGDKVERAGLEMASTLAKPIDLGAWEPARLRVLASTLSLGHWGELTDAETVAASVIAEVLLAGGRLP